MNDIKKETFESADALIQALDPLNRRWRPEPRKWVFRGHGERTWKLLPSSRRPGAFKRFAYHIPAVPHNRWTLIQAEYEVLFAFFAASDESGLTIPGDGQHFRAHTAWAATIQPLLLSAASGDAPWPMPDVLTMMALAQHHRVPTPLLDWTRRPLVAAYFAAKEAVARSTGLRPADPDSDGVMSIWGVTPSALRMTPGAARRLEFVTAPQGTNANLRAQSGLFIVDGRIDDWAGGGIQVPALDELIRDLGHDTRGARPNHRTTIRQLDLPWAQAPRLLRLLADHGVDARTVFPGFDGVSEALTEPLMWDRDDD